MKTITIGQCNTSGSWTKYYDPYPDTHSAFYISSNSESYRVHNLLLGFDILLSRDTFEGAKLTTMLSNEVLNHDEIWQYANSLVLANITAEEYINAVDETLLKVAYKAFDKGADYVRKELKSLLDIKN